MQRSLLHSILRTQATGFAPRVSRKCLRFPVRNSSTQAAGRSFNSTLVFATSIVSGLSGYYISQTWPSISTFGTVEPRYGTAKDFKNAINELRVEFGEDGISTDPDILDPYGYSMNDYHPGTSHHSVVVFPRSTEDVSKIVKIASKYSVPVTPFAGGTSLEGNFRAHAAGGICVDLSGMDKIIEIHEADSDAVCQAGVKWVDLNEALKEQGMPLFFPVDPAPGATLGGLVATGGSGTNAVRYGTAKGEWFLNATVVLPSGEIIKTRRRAHKSAAGFDLTKLFIGAEGTLGIVTEVTVKLAPVLPTTVAVVQFPDVQKATEAVTDMLNKGVGIQCIELCDDQFMHATNNHGVSERKWAEKDSLFIKFQGPNQNSLKDSVKMAQAISRKHGSLAFEMARNDKEAVDLWSDRKNGHYSTLALIPGCKGWATDVCVPPSSLPKLVLDTKEDMKECGITGVVVGHVGDGNFHTSLLFTTEEELAKIKQIVKRMVKRAIALDGTCTGEHGVGIGKKEYLYEELGVGTVDLMKKIKQTIDPKNILNPGKLYPDAPKEAVSKDGTR